MKMAISLKIKGNKRSNEGIGIDHVSIGDQSFPVSDRQYSPAVAVNDVIVIRHYPDKSVYSVVTTNVVSIDGTRAGTLIIAIAVKRGEQVAGLYNLLLELSQFYKANYMYWDGAKFHFTDRHEVAADFERILERYPVTHYPFRHVANAGDDSSVAYIYMAPAEIAHLLNDPMRDEFAAFGQIVLVPAGNPADSTIQVPAMNRREYSLTVNGKAVSARVSDPDKILNISVPATKTHLEAAVRFTINEARKGAIKGATVIIDDFAQTITVNVIQPAKETPIQSIPHNEIPERQNRKKGFGKTETIAVIAGAVILMGFLIWFLFGKSSGNEQNTEPQTEITTPPGDNTDTDTPNPDDVDAENDINEAFGNLPLEDAEQNTKEVKKEKTAEEIAFETYCDKLSMKQSLTKAELKDILKFKDGKLVTTEQRKELKKLLETIGRLNNALGPDFHGDVKKLRTTLSDIQKTAVPNVKSYIGDLLKLGDDNLDEFCIRWENKTDQQPLYDLK